MSSEVVRRDPGGRFQKGCSGNPAGLKKGTKYLATQIRDAFLSAFYSTGGIEGLIDWIKRGSDNRKEFYKMVLPLLPKEELAEDKTRIVNIINYERANDSSGSCISAEQVRVRDFTESGAVQADMLAQESKEDHNGAE